MVKLSWSCKCCHSEVEAELYLCHTSINSIIGGGGWSGVTHYRGWEVNLAVDQTWSSDNYVINLGIIFFYMQLNMFRANVVMKLHNSAYTWRYCMSESCIWSSDIKTILYFSRLTSFILKSNLKNVYFLYKTGKQF